MANAVAARIANGAPNPTYGSAGPLAPISKAYCAASPEGRSVRLATVVRWRSEGEHDEMGVYSASIPGSDTRDRWPGLRAGAAAAEVLDIFRRTGVAGILANSRPNDG